VLKIDDDFLYKLLCIIIAQI